ncbi:MAG: CDP-diacylglycerol--glycerol-3-phosphate 3-phosphatidyltransferase [Azospirillum brasilense]|nr:MAG: CDP-diacylglycerol--glycerol-3-phosphate 3-phosphatidyltransferase [Azospirillum brasilense]
MLTKQNIPNLLTYARVAAVPAALFIATVMPGLRQLMFWIFLAAAITDFFDGYLARKWNAVSATGALLDPIADKLLVAVALLYLLEYTNAPIGAVGIILCRELYIAGLREFLAKRQIDLPVSRGGKWKTALQLSAITLLLATVANYPMPYLRVGEVMFNAWNVGVILLWVSALLALSSAFSYTRSAQRSL